MKKWLLLIVSLLLFAATVEAGCGSEACGTKKGAEDKVACSLKAAEDKAACSADKAKCSAEKAKPCGADCTKPCCADKGSKKPWWKFWSK